MSKLTLNLLVLVLPFAFIRALAIAETNEGLRVGIITDLSGAYAQYGKETQAGATLAEMDLRETGSNLRVIIEDSALSPNRAVQAAQKLIAFDKVDALYVDFAITSIAVSPVARASNKILVSAASVRSILDSSPLTFRTFLDYRQSCEELAAEFKRQGIKKLGFMKAESEYGELCAQGISQVFPDPIVVSYKQKETVQSQVLRLKSQKVDGVINAAYEVDLSNMLQAASSLGFAARFGAPQEAFSKGLLERFGPMLEGSITFAMPETSRNLIDRAHALEGVGEMTSFERLGTVYVHLRQLVEAFSACPSKGAECAAERLASAGRDSRIGFEGWKERSAIFSSNVKCLRRGAFSSCLLSHEN